MVGCELEPIYHTYG